MTDASTITRVLADPGLFGLIDAAHIAIPRGEPRRLLADLADALAARAPYEDVESKLAAAAESLWTDDAHDRIAGTAARDDDAVPLAEAGAESPVALSLAYRAALALVARDERVQAPLRDVEPTFAELDKEDRERLAPALAQSAIPALPLDIALMKDEGYQFVAIFPPEGSEGVDIVGKAAKWLTKRMTMEGDAPRIAMRHFLALLAEEVEVELPIISGTIDHLLAEPAPPLPAQDTLFVALARGLVEEAVAERGFPF